MSMFIYIKHAILCMISWDILVDALNGLHHVFSQWKKLKGFDCLIKFASSRSTEDIDEIKKRYPLSVELVFHMKKIRMHRRIRN